LDPKSTVPVHALHKVPAIYPDRSWAFGGGDEL
jgi:hypothetical protein